MKRAPAAKRIALAVLGLAVAASIGYAAFALLSPSRRPAVDSAPRALQPIALYRHPRTIPGFRFDNAAGRRLTLTDFRGKVLLVNFWATWCVPCRKEMPTLNRLEARLGGKRFQVVAIAQGPTGLAAVRRFFRRAHLHRLAPYIDPTMHSIQALGIYGIPTTLLVGRDGRELARKLGAADWNSRQMIRFLGHLIGTTRAGRPEAEREPTPAGTASGARPGA